MKMIIFGKRSLWSREALSFHFWNLYDDTGGINNNFILHNWKLFGKICLTLYSVNQYMSSEWFLALCVCTHTCACKDRRAIHAAGQRIHISQTRWKAFWWFSSLQYKKFYNYLKRLLKISSLSSLHKNLNEGQIFFKWSNILQQI